MIRNRLLILALPAVLLIAACATPGPGSTDPEPAPQSAPALHNPRADFAVDIWSVQAPLRIGEFLDLRLRSRADAYLSLYVINSSGKTAQLLQNRYVHGGRTLRFPGHESPVDYQLIPPPGAETYILVATREPLEWLAPADIRSHGPLAELNFTGRQLLERLRFVLERQNPHAWNAQAINLPLQRMKR